MAVSSGQLCSSYRFMKETEMRDTEIEKEALLIILACEQFSDYILGKTTAIKTNHKPLVPLLSTEHHPECFVSAFN